MIRNLLLAAVSLTVAAVLAEVAVRLLRPQLFPVHPPGMYVLDDDVGYALTPDFAGRLERAEFSARFTVDDRGLRNGAQQPESGTPDADAPRDALRVALLGDSQTFGFGVRDEETFGAHLEALLEDATGEDVVVLNAGVPGYGTADQLAFLRSRWETLEPDIVIVQFLPANDFAENKSPAKEWVAIREGMLASRDAAPSRARWTVRGARRWLKRHSHLAALVSENAGFLAMRMGLLDAESGALGESFDEEDANRARELLGEIARFSRERGARTLFLYATTKADVVANRYVPRPSAEVVASAARDSDVPWVDANPFLRDRPDRLDVYWRLDGHWSPAGHRAVAELLARELAELGWLSSPAAVSQ